MNIYQLTLEDLEDFFLNLNEKKYKAIQVYDWLYKKRITSFSQMTNIKKNIISLLENNFKIEYPKLVLKQKGDGVYKYLFSLSDGFKIESVVMIHNYGNSLCISTEVGCNMGCAFCESGVRKKSRNLFAFEMISQLLFIERDLNLRISHVVLMGIGEPFDNYDNVMRFIKIINCNKGIDIGARHITVSTCGIVPKIYSFASEKLQVNLAISLHAPNDEIRNKLMKINKVYPISEVIKAVNYYIKVTNRRVTFEYIMLDKVNDSIECAFELSNLIKGMNAYVNLIPYNETSHTQFKKSSKKRILNFYDVLKKNNINVTIRKEFGGEIDAACGQLRSKMKEDN